MHLTFITKATLISITKMISILNYRPSPSIRCVVWTGDGRVFFYNPSTKTSVWERPEELADRADVTKAMSTVPEQLLASNPANVVPSNRSTAQNSTPAVAMTMTPNIIMGTGGLATGGSSVAIPVVAVDKEQDQMGSESDSGEDREDFPSKKFKGDDGE